MVPRLLNLSEKHVAQVIKILISTRFKKHIHATSKNEPFQYGHLFQKQPLFDLL